MVAIKHPNMPMSPAQRELIGKLARELYGANAVERMQAIFAEVKTRGEAGEQIDGMIAASKARRNDRVEQAPKAAPGYYVRPADGAAVVVVESKNNPGRTYGKVLVFPVGGGRPSWEYVRGAGYTVADLEPLTAEAAAKIGLAHGYCVRCCAELGGQTLSAAISALIGYGETCAKRMGWAYPKGAVAQRAYLAEHGR